MSTAEDAPPGQQINRDVSTAEDAPPVPTDQQGRDTCLRCEYLSLQFQPVAFRYSVLISNVYVQIHWQMPAKMMTCATECCNIGQAGQTLCLYFFIFAPICIISTVSPWQCCNVQIFDCRLNQIYFESPKRQPNSMHGTDSGGVF